jgi:molecular chaperone DnaK
MIKDAEANAEEDKKFQELVTTRNMADSLVYSTNQMLDELKEEVSEDEKTTIKAAMKL